MTRTQAAYHRNVKARLAKLGAADKFNAARVDELFDAWATPAQAASALAAPLREHLCTPMTVGEAAIAASTVI
jgi:hypothetical protein